MTDEGRFRDVSLETLTTFFDEQVEKLVNRGVPPDRVADALKMVVIRTELLHKSPPWTRFQRSPIGAISGTAPTP